MRLVSYRKKGSNGPYQAGVERDQLVVDVSQSQKGRSTQLPALSVRELLEQGDQQLQSVLAWAAEQIETEREVLTLDTLELGPPIPDPEKIICLGGNYAQHLAEAGNADMPSFPIFFAKYRNSLVGPTDPIVLPRASKAVDYEGELAVVIGKRAKDVSKEQALSYVAGYTICNDVSARDLQVQAGQWMAGKAIDTFAPMGPGIVLSTEIPDPQTLNLITRHNGDVVQNANTSDMIFSVAEAIAFLSTLMTLEPGDIIATGTPSGVGFSYKPPRLLQNGDIVEVEIEGIGLIRNPVIDSTGVSA